MNKKLIPVIVGVVALLGITSVFLLSNKEDKAENQPTVQSPTSSEIKPVDESVKVDLKAGKAQGYYVISIEGIPEKTETIEYEFSYNTEEQGLQGSINEPVSVKGKKTFTKEIFFGTQSSGAKTYHKVDGPITINILFTGGYGQQSFEKEYEL